MAHNSALEQDLAGKFLCGSSCWWLMLSAHSAGGWLGAAFSEGAGMQSFSLFPLSSTTSPVVPHWSLQVFSSLARLLLRSLWLPRVWTWNLTSLPKAWAWKRPSIPPTAFYRRGQVTGLHQSVHTQSVSHWGPPIGQVPQPPAGCRDRLCSQIHVKGQCFPRSISLLLPSHFCIFCVPSLYFLNVSLNQLTLKYRQIHWKVKFCLAAVYSGLRLQ